MKELKIEIHIRSYAYEELSEEERRLVDAAKEATARSYAPYSRFHVGAAALLANGIIVSGSNQENAAYPSGTCAERTTLFYANSQYPDQPVKALAIAARNASGFLDSPIPPCGACRQVLLETISTPGAWQSNRKPACPLLEWLNPFSPKYHTSAAMVFSPFCKKGAMSISS